MSHADTPSPSSSGGYPLDGKHTYFLLDDRWPARVTEPDTVPDVFVNGKWEPYYNLTRFFSDAVSVSKEEFDRAVAEQGGGREPSNG